MEIKYANEMIEKTQKARAIQSKWNKEEALTLIKENIMPDIEFCAGRGINTLTWRFNPKAKLGMKQWCSLILCDYGYKTTLLEESSLLIKWEEDKEG